MDGCLGWQTHIDDEFPHPFQTKHLGLDNELMEILWHNGEAVLHSQTSKKPGPDSGPKFDDLPQPEDEEEDEHQVSWINSPANESFHCDDLLSEIPTCHHLSGKADADVDKLLKFPSSLMSPPRFGSDELNRGSSDLRFQHGFVMETSVITKEMSHGSTDQAANETNTSRDVGKHVMGTENTSCGGSGISCRKESSVSSDNTRNKRKRDVEEPECPSDATELESPNGNTRKAHRRRRVAEVHNQSERRRRDRINEKMRALQALIPHSHKLDKASVLDEAIEYMKALQLQLQWWMGTGMAQMMLPRIPPQYMYHPGLGIRPPPTFPAVQNMMCLSNQMPMGHGFMFGHQFYQNQMQNAAPNAAAQKAFSSQPAPEVQIAAHQPHNSKSQMNLQNPTEGTTNSKTG